MLTKQFWMRLSCGQGLFPLPWQSDDRVTSGYIYEGAGSQVMQRIAAPMIGGAGDINDINFSCYPHNISDLEKCYIKQKVS